MIFKDKLDDKTNLSVLVFGGVAFGFKEKTDVFKHGY